MTSRNRWIIAVKCDKWKPTPHRTVCHYCDGASFHGEMDGRFVSRFQRNITLALTEDKVQRIFFLISKDCSSSISVCPHVGVTHTAIFFVIPKYVTGCVSI